MDWSWARSVLVVRGACLSSRERRVSYKEESNSGRVVGGLVVRWRDRI